MDSFQGGLFHLYIAHCDVVVLSGYYSLLVELSHPCKGLFSQIQVGFRFLYLTFILQFLVAVFFVIKGNKKVSLLHLIALFEENLAYNAVYLTAYVYVGLSIKRACRLFHIDHVLRHCPKNLYRHHPVSPLRFVFPHSHSRQIHDKNHRK